MQGSSVTEADWRRWARKLFEVVCQDVDPERTLEIAVLATAFKDVGDPERVKLAIMEFVDAGEFPPEGNFLPLYEKLAA
jgi:hypothetical protein